MRPERAVIIEAEPHDAICEFLSEAWFCLRMGALLGLAIIFLKVGLS